MNPSDFASYKTSIRSAIRAALAEAEPGTLDEAAFPAYSHPNPFINWLFWQRLRVVMNFIERHAPFDYVLDFGCGSGVLLPFLAAHSQRVLGLDVDLLAYRVMSKRLNFPASIEVRDANQNPLASLPAASFNLITALDVLEHVEDLSTTLHDLMRLLRPGGWLVVSGPTETIFYKIGRKLAGPEYSGAYHERGIPEVRAQLGKLAPVRTLARLYPPVTLFDIFAAQKKIP
ncbi:MAG: Ubiquinone biosynthesis O-methyltransferase [Anaerolineales bacterium]|nr:Ubiquinone biosynthesis O-methyltransferase [Anaerolineales bacterium]